MIAGGAVAARPPAFRKSSPMIDQTNAASAVKDVTTATFAEDVIKASMTAPVLVDFWAPWCGPCKQLAPVLEKVVAAAGGKVSLVKMNIDDHPEVAGQMGIQSIPAVIAFKRGQPVDGFMGATPEGQIRSFIERLVGPLGPTPVDALLEEAAVLVAEDDLAGASAIYAEILEQEPDNPDALAALVKLHVVLEDLEGARSFLALVPADKVNHPEVASARAALELAEQAGDLGSTAELEARLAADPDDHQARFDLALARNGAGDHQGAVEELLTIFRKDRSWNDEAARRQLVQFFEAWGPKNPATLSGRRRLSSLMFA